MKEALDKMSLCGLMNCKRCELRSLGLCSGCSNARCLVRRCVALGERVEGVTEPCESCRYRAKFDLCSGRFAVSEAPAIRIGKRRKPLELPALIPVVSLYDRVSWVWDAAGAPAAFIKLEEFLEALPAGGELDLRGLLGFGGKLLLSFVIPDEIIDALDGPLLDEVADLIDGSGFDAWMVADDYTYLDDPYRVSWSRLFRMLKRAEYLLGKVKAYPIGLVKGASEEQIKWCVERNLDLGLTTLALPCRGIPPETLAHFLEAAFRSLEGVECALILYGINPIRAFWYFHGLITSRPESVAFSVATASWFVDASDGDEGRAFFEAEDSSVRLARLSDLVAWEGAPRCGCKFCGGRGWRELAKDAWALVRHNYLYSAYLAEWLRLGKPVGWRPAQVG